MTKIAEFDLLQDLRNVGFNMDDMSEFTDELHAMVEGRRNQDTDDLLKWGLCYLSHYFTKSPSILHETLSVDLTPFHKARGQRYTVVAPRGSAKSTFATLAYPLQCICEGHERYILIVSDTYEQAKAFLEAIREELEDNEKLAAAYPYAVGRGRTWTKNRIQTANGITVEVLSRGMKVRGRRKKQNRPTLIIVDDMENDDDAFSPIQREKTASWFNKALLKAGSPTTNIIVLGTIIHREAILPKLQRTPGWKNRFFRAIMEWPENMKYWDKWEEIFSDLTNENAEKAAKEYFERHRRKMTKGARVLWPEYESLYDLMVMRLMEGKPSFESEKQNNPRDPALVEWPEEYFGDHIWFEKWPPLNEFTIRTISLDPSKGRDAKHGDYQAFVRLGRHKSGLLYVEADLLRVPMEDLPQQGLEYLKRFKQCNAFTVEVNQWQELLAADFKQLVAAEGLILPLHLINNQVKKEIRIRRLGPYLSQRMFKFNRKSEGTRLLVEQLMDFPTGSHDDGPDGLEMALRTAIELSHEEITV